MNYNMSIETARAQAWKKEVDAELEAVAQVLEKVNEVCLEVQNEEDTIMNSIYEVGTFVQTSWKELTNVFRDVQDYLSEAIKTMEKGGSAALEKVQNIKNQFSR